MTRIRDIGRVEIGAADYGSTAYMDRSDGLPLLIFAQPGANSLAVEHEVLSTIATLKKDFPTGVDSIVIYDPTIFVAKSVREVVTTIFVAILLVVGVVILFLQTWRASIIPVVAIPISLIGTFVVLYALGISLNNLSLFGLVLAVGIVVDDAIVVVENVERNISAGMSAVRRGAPHDGRGRRRADLHRPDALRGVRALGVPVRHLGAVLPPVRRDHRGLDGDLLLRLADPQSRRCARCCSTPHDGAARRRAGLPARLISAGFGRFNRGFEWLSQRLRSAHAPPRPRAWRWSWRSMSR